MKRTVSLILAIITLTLVFTSCSKSNIKVTSILGDKTLVDKFENIISVDYILDDVSNVDLNKTLEVDDTYTKKVSTDESSATSIISYYKDDVLVYEDYEGYGEDTFSFFTKSKNNNDLTVSYIDQEGKRYSTTISAKTDKGLYAITFEEDCTYIMVKESTDSMFELSCNYEIRDNIATLVSANYLDESGKYIRYSSSYIDEDTTEIYNETIYDIFSGETFDIAHLKASANNLYDIELLMGKHLVSYTKDSEAYTWYITSDICFVFSSEADASAFANANGLKYEEALASKEGYYTVTFENKTLKVMNGCEISNEKSFKDFCETEWADYIYYDITLNGLSEITAFSHDTSVLMYY